MKTECVPGACAEYSQACWFENTFLLLQWVAVVHCFAKDSLHNNYLGSKRRHRT